MNFAGEIQAHGTQRFFINLKKKAGRLALGFRRHMENVGKKSVFFMPKYTS